MTPEEVARHAVDAGGPWWLLLSGGAPATTQISLQRAVPAMPALGCSKARCPRPLPCCGLPVPLLRSVPPLPPLPPATPATDVHVVGVSSQAAGHGTLVPQLVDELRKAGMDHVLVVCGGIIPKQDQPALRAAGVAAFYGPGTRVPAAALDIIGMLLDEPQPLVAGTA